MIFGGDLVDEAFNATIEDKSDEQLLYVFQWDVEFLRDELKGDSGVRLDQSEQDLGADVRQ